MALNTQLKVKIVTILSISLTDDLSWFYKKSRTFPTITFNTAYLIFFEGATIKWEETSDQVGSPTFDNVKANTDVASDMGAGIAKCQAALEVSEKDSKSVVCYKSR